MSKRSVSSSDYSSRPSRKSSAKNYSIKSSISDISKSSKSSASSRSSRSSNKFKSLITPGELATIEASINQTVNKELAEPRVNILSKLYNTFEVAASQMSNMAQGVVDILYSKLIIAINKKLVNEIQVRKTLEEEIKNLERDISNIAHEEYEVDYIIKNKYNDAYNHNNIYNFLFKTPEGIKTIRKIHKHYLIDYYVLKYGNYKNEKKLRMIYEDSVIPIQIKLEKNDPEPCEGDKLKMNAFKFNICAYFIQALCYDEVAGRGIDLLQNEFTISNNAGENNMKISSITSDLCLKNQPLTKRKRSKYIMDNAVAASPDDIKLSIMKKYKTESKVVPSSGRKGVKKTLSRYTGFLYPKKSKRQTIRLKSATSKK